MAQRGLLYELCTLSFLTAGRRDVMSRYYSELTWWIPVIFTNRLHIPYEVCEYTPRVEVTEHFGETDILLFIVWNMYTQYSIMSMGNAGGPWQSGF